MDEFQLERQSYYDRKNADKLDYDEIISVLPHVNPEWLFSTSEHELKNLPVRDDLTEQAGEIPDKLTGLKEKIADEGVDYEAQDQLIEYLQDRTKSLSQELSEISILLNHLRSSMKS